METLRMLFIFIFTLFAPFDVPSAKAAEVYSVESQNLTALPLDIQLNVTDIILDNNDIEEIPDFPYLKDLRNLQLTGNRIHTFPDLCLVNNSLEELMMGSNQLTNISGELLNCLGHLTKLNLGDNKLISFPSIQGMVELRSLYLHKNQLKELADFPYLEHFRYLNLVKNQIHTFPDMCLVNNSLEELLLGDNQLTNISEELLDCLGHLTKLHLTSNQLISFPTVGGMANTLRKLYLNKNQLQVLPPVDIVGPNLVEIHFGSNPLTSTDIPLSILAMADKLTIFQWAEYGLTDLQVLDALSYFTSLLRLYLSSNLLTTVPDLTPIANTLTQLHVNANPITNVDWNMIGKLKKLTYINLVKCQLQTVPFICHMGPQLKINLYDNPLICDHRMKWIVAGHLSGKVLVSSKPCAEPGNLVDTPITELTVSNMAPSTGTRSFHIQKLDLTTFGCTGLKAELSEVPVSSLEDCATLTVSSGNSLAFRYHGNEPGSKTCSVVTFSEIGVPLEIDNDMYIMD